ncbi:hypothetical protein BACCAP_03597 [Pseudoflavonifractor capillosus ATCC 29799]|uniref:Uncharacterized protein n=1 Tax=Pseudoflavonifractor capillosus ATCC 29799 TaxID=411467 RepID=A6NZE6_9FIRM|nr:hypothetical protein BACCAP_03597 [Pseudoflavonifractor capillosus ATCC 29799]
MAFWIKNKQDMALLKWAAAARIELKDGPQGQGTIMKKEKHAMIRIYAAENYDEMSEKAARFIAAR